MDFLKNNGKGFLLCLIIALPSWWLGKCFPIIGGAVGRECYGKALSVPTAGFVNSVPFNRVVFIISYHI